VRGAVVLLLLALGACVRSEPPAVTKVRHVPDPTTDAARDNGVDATTDAPADSSQDGSADTGTDARVVVDAPPDSPIANRATCAYGRGATAAATLGPDAVIGAANPIEHIIVVMQENRSFDSYLARLADYEASIGIFNTIESASPTATNPSYPAGLPNADGGVILDAAVFHHAPELCSFDTAHWWTPEHVNLDHGRNDGFYFTNANPSGPNTAGIAPSYLDGNRALAWYDQTDLPFYYTLYSTFAMADHYFADVLGPTYPNRMYLYAATSFGVTDNFFPDLSAYPYPGPNPAVVFDELQTSGASWALYAETTPAAGIVLGVGLESRYGFYPTRTLAEFYGQAMEGTLPAVSFVDADFTSSTVTTDDEHPPSEIELGQHFVWSIVNAITTSPSWSTSALFITYDESGGLYDHVPPPAACVPDATSLIWDNADDKATGGRFDRYGFRVPFVVVSPYAKRSYVSHTVFSHASITRFIEAKEGLLALSARDANADPFSDMFDWSDPPYLTPPTFPEPTVNASAVARCVAELNPCNDGGTRPGCPPRR